MGKPNEISVEVQVDTTQLDIAIKKAESLVQLLERADALAYRIGIDMAKSKDMVSVQTYVRGGKDD